MTNKWDMNDRDRKKENRKRKKIYSSKHVRQKKFSD